MRATAAHPSFTASSSTGVCRGYALCGVHFEAIECGIAMKTKPLLHLLSLLWFCSSSLTTAEPMAVEVRRLPGNPIIRPEMLPGSDGDNINGPSLIRVPSWVT